MKRIIALVTILLSAGVMFLLQETAGAQTNEPDALAFPPTWSNVVTITNDANTPGGAERPDIEISPNGNKLTIAYIKRRGISDSDPYFSQSTNDGSSWSAPAAIHETNGVESLYVDIAFDGKNAAHAVWTEGIDLVYKNGSSWGNIGVVPTVISQPSFPPGTSYPEIEATGNNVLDVVWSEGSLGTPDILHSRSIDSGQNWSTPVRVAITPPSSSFPSMAIDNSGRLHVVWEEGTTTESIHYAMGTPTGPSSVSINWTPSITITAPGADEARRPRIATDGGNLFVSYTNLRDSNQQQETIRQLRCSGQCSIAGNWFSVPTSSQEVGIFVPDPNDSIVSDILHANGCTYIYFDGTSTDFSKGTVWGNSSCEGARHKIFSDDVQSNNPSQTAYGQWLYLAVERRTSDPSFAQLYFVKGKMPSYSALPVIFRK